LTERLIALMEMSGPISLTYEKFLLKNSYNMSELHNTTCIFCCQAAAADWHILQHKQHMTKTASERQVKHVDHLCFISDKPPWKLIFFHQPRSSLRISSFRSSSIKIHLLHTNQQTTWFTRLLLHLGIEHPSADHMNVCQTKSWNAYYSWSHITRNNHNGSISIKSEYFYMEPVLRIQHET